mgnify:CR=1 FL=1
MNLIALIWGIANVLAALLCMIPMLGWGNWFVIPSAVLGSIIGAIASKKGGLLINIVALILASFRLLLGGGII